MNKIAKYTTNIILNLMESIIALRAKTEQNKLVEVKNNFMVEETAAGKVADSITENDIMNAILTLDNQLHNSVRSPLESSDPIFMIGDPNGNNIRIHGGDIRIIGGSAGLSRLDPINWGVLNKQEDQLTDKEKEILKTLRDYKVDLDGLRAKLKFDLTQEKEEKRKRELML